MAMLGYMDSKNKRIFDSKILSPEDIISKAISEAVEWQSAQQQEKEQAAAPPENMVRIAHHQLPNHLKVCTDAAWSETQKQR